jgi:hypothetical protein
MSSESSKPKAITALPIKKLSEISLEPESKRWLIRPLWMASAVGIVGGEPKTFKTWLTGEISHAVATGQPAFGLFDVEAQGSVLVFHHEDGQQQMRSRFESIATAHGTRIEDIPICFLDVPALHLDDSTQVEALRMTVSELKPRLIVLDPFVRLVRGLDENSASDVARVLGELRQIQRDFDVAVLLVHHMRKSRTAHPGQQLRGSGDFAAWTDSAIYVGRSGEDRLLTVEHRAARAPEPIRVRLATSPAPHLMAVTEPQKDAEAHTREREGSIKSAILEQLELIPGPQRTAAIRDKLKTRKATIVAALTELQKEGLVEKTSKGWLKSNQEELL